MHPQLPNATVRPPAHDYAVTLSRLPALVTPLIPFNLPTQVQRQREHYVRPLWWRNPGDVPPTPTEAPHEPPADPSRPHCFIPLEVPTAAVSTVMASF